jgi:stage V sporulation protein AC
MSKTSNATTLTPQEYKKMVKEYAPKSRSVADVAKAFTIGGGICVLAQLLNTLFRNMGFNTLHSGVWTSVCLITITAILTGLGAFGKIAKHAGAGTLVPITGFANAVSSSALEAKSEGYVLGVGAKIFTVAGPVILYGISASMVYGFLYWLLG